MAEPTIEETARLLRRMHSAGTVRRLDFIHMALCAAYKTGWNDALAEQERDQQSG